MCSKTFVFDILVCSRTMVLDELVSLTMVGVSFLPLQNKSSKQEECIVDDISILPVCMSSPNKQRRICGQIFAFFAIVIN